MPGTRQKGGSDGARSGELAFRQIRVSGIQRPLPDAVRRTAKNAPPELAGREDNGESPDANPDPIHGDAPFSNPGIGALAYMYPYQGFVHVHFWVFSKS